MRAVVTLVVLLSGCGYHLPGAVTTLPPDVRTVSVAVIENRSREFGLEKLLAFALEQEFLRRGLVQVVNDPGGGDVVLSGSIQEFGIRPVAFDADDEALQYEAAVVVDLVLRRRDDGSLLWEVKGLQEVDEYSASSRVVVTSSSQFQRGQLNDSDLAKLSDIQLADTEKRLAIERLIRATARDAHDQMVEGF